MRRTMRWATPVLAAMVLFAITTTGSSAQVAGVPDVVGQWTQPFEEGGANTPRCVPAEG